VDAITDMLPRIGLLSAFSTEQVRLGQRRNGEISNLKLQIFQEPKISAVSLPKTRKGDSLVAVQEKGFI
ncbi:MAG TPA: hypothetical protein VFI70_01520, partial [Nitrososphaeraceae archaeon]|nr:hypothetical protein [Nitrososphaeraceae archaeon]